MARTRTSSDSSCSCRSTGSAPSRSIGSSSRRSARRSATAGCPPAAPAAVVARARRPARRVARDRRRGVRAAGRRGLPVSRPGGATRVARPRSPTPARAPAIEPAAAFEFDFRPGRPDVVRVSRAAVAAPACGRPSRRRRASASPTSAAGRPGAAGALAAYLNRVRGTAADPADVVICAGSRRASGWSARRSADGGARRFAVEDPSDPEYREIVARPGSRSSRSRSTRTACGSTSSGARGRRRARHGGPPVPDGRGAAAGAAGGAGGVGDAAPARSIVEDDYDAEFRYDREPIGAHPGPAPGPVVYAGSASKMLAPGLRLGWLLAPRPGSRQPGRREAGGRPGSPALDQLALADFIAHGELDRHLRRMRPIYRGARDALLAALARHLPRCGRSGRRRACTCWPGCRPTSTRARSSRRCRGPGSRIGGSRRAGGSRRDRAA